MENGSVRLNKQDGRSYTVLTFLPDLQLEKLSRKVFSLREL